MICTLAMGTTVLFSDLHFGYEKFNRDEFERFLTYLEKESNASKLLILGDIFDLWRADAIDSVAYGWPYLDKLRNLNVETHYIVGSHDYHNWLSCQTASRTDFLWLHVGYPWQVSDSVFVVHGDYFDIYALRAKVVQQAIYGVYEAIYHGDKTTVRALERYFYDPVMLLYKWLQLYRKKPEQAKAEHRMLRGRRKHICRDRKRQRSLIQIQEWQKNRDTRAIRDRTRSEVTRKLALSVCVFSSRKQSSEFIRKCSRLDLEPKGFPRLTG
jgi:UDP-2,3-diacylglucosamine pyrophosphatase LpxH